MGLFNTKNINGVFVLDKVKLTITSIRVGARLLWRNIKSCFGSGKWVGNKPWIGKEKWKGTK